MATRRSTMLIGMCATVCVTGGCHLTDWAENGFRLGPNHHAPPAAVAEAWLDSTDDRVLPSPPNDLDWWTVLDDPHVDGLVRTALAQNLTVRQAGERILQARANRAIAAGNRFPQVQQAFGGLLHVQESKSVALPPPLRAFDEWETGFNASWELDVWGKFRRAVESADASLEASIADYDAIVVSLIADVVTAYADLRTFEERLEYARQNAQIQEKSLQLSKDQFELGKSSRVGVELAEASLSATRATIPALETGLRQSSNRLCTLLGIPPTELAPIIGVGSGIPSVPSRIAVGIPADLLRRRPDVLRAERAVAAQSAQIGIALSDLYPSIAITGEIFLASEEFADLFHSASTAGSFGPSFRWNLLNYGRIENNVRLQESGLRELIAAYQQSVLVANQEVEDALVAFLRSQDEVRYLHENVDDLSASLELLQIQYKEGKIDFSPIFLLQGTLRTAQDQLAASEGRLLTNMVAVYRALGGGWRIRFGEARRPLDQRPSEQAPDRELPLPTEASRDLAPAAGDNRFLLPVRSVSE